MIALQLCCWTESFLSKKLFSRLHSIEVEFYSKQEKFAFEPPFGRLRGNARTSSIARWKARVRLPIGHNWTFFASSYCWDVTGGNLSTWVIFEGGWVTSIAHFRCNGTSPTNHCWVKKTRRIALSFSMKISPVGCLDSSQSMHVTDRRTDRRTELRLPRPR